ncbi:MAG: ribosomal subunit interface protein [Candidatus Doudnabacteria bacterium CG10_big_fil_rev_8_21_14_0_10_42_18]|uniref:Ribosomal subunit interface protein n=1 Tax=Candidatus Doudnabacteria bacterium CG10_big_fil_rev_8_21_14_0_10_42_18 TaxID=1974552 RepID=A0A2H0VBT1_9BACT|nr:MAG: ribosomal subunit interface protein [Candidatus Doudnabacteria bacterium CG10_big_fil_rev_8_21_14_0_10_42_18]
MNITIKATKTTLTPAIKKFINEKLQSLDKFIKQEDKIHIEVEVNKKHQKGPIYRAEIDIQPHGYHAESYGEDFYAAMDMLIPKIFEQLTKRKGKNLAKRREARKTVRQIKKGAF